ncbi:MAG: DNA-3-methyladenine glycosylase [Desulfovibrionaceae bacterium CG1_02_65_16]|nr:MAG: DNA-3-methyladenine glycosylase [Desulfovibrionaceae bacterium CG1_02_65_16]
MPTEPKPYRCPWCTAGAAAPDPVYVAYHDAEWGAPLRDDDALFELLVLEGAQAGLNWRMVLHRRPGYRAAFGGEGAGTLSPAAVARLGEADKERLRLDERIIRNRQKIAAAIGNARAFLEIQTAFGSFADYLWRFVDGRPVQNAWRAMAEIPVRTPVSDALAKDLGQRGMKFVGTTIMYAYMQSAGLVNDHLTACFRHAELGG